MEDAALSPNLDFDFTDELLLDGYWYRSPNESELVHPSVSTAPFGSPCLCSTPPNNSNPNLGSIPAQKDTQMEEQESILPTTNELQEESPVTTQSLSMIEPVRRNHYIEDSEIGERFQIGPRPSAGPPYSVMERLNWMVEFIRSSLVDRDTLIQIWVPVNRGGMSVLISNGQPFSLDPCCPKLVGYRNISMNYQFAAEKDSNESLGLPGRVFLGKVPEWTPDVRFFKRDEFRRVDYAQQYNVSGTFALPIFEQGSKACLGVIEIVMTTQKINYHLELETVCKALEAVDLRSTGASSTRHIQGFDGSYQVTASEILKVLRTACLKHNLPLAQTWAPCVQQGKGGLWHTDENYLNCVSTLDFACYVANSHAKDFHEACSEHHLFKGQGVAGGAFMTNQPCFSPDIASFRKMEYPLSHHARMFGLRAAVAIRLRSIYTGADFALEFFLPLDCTDHEEQKKMLYELSIIVQQVCRSLRIITNKELEEETGSLVNEESVPSVAGPRTSYVQAQQTCDLTPMLDKGKQKEILTEDSNLKGSTLCNDRNSIFGECSFSSVDKAGERRRTKSEKTITLQVLGQYFAGSLKDAAKSLGVCPTTLKRICRQHGISRWPSRKIKKVGHSLQKLQLVIDSVHGSSGAFPISPIYSSVSELTSPNISGSNPLTTSKLNDGSKPPIAQPQDETFCPKNVSSKSGSLCSQSSSSSYCYSSGTQKHHTNSDVTVGGDSLIGENSGDCVLKRLKGDSELLSTCQGGPKLILGTKSHKSLNKQTDIESTPPMSYNSGFVSVEGNSWRVKVAYGEEKVRLRMQSSWGFKDLMQEVGRRFRIDDISGFQMKYLDDDSEWVLLTCDADLEECADVYKSLQVNTIKLVLLDSSHHCPSSWGSSDRL